MVSENDITFGVEFYEDVICIRSLTKGQINDTIYAKLSHIFQLLSPDMLPQLHGETRRQVFLILHISCRVDANARLDQQMQLNISSTQLE